MEAFGKQMLKITILGANKSGKTALTVRFLTGKFIFEYASGHDIVYQHNFLVASTKVPLQIVDTSCNENLSDAIYGSDGIVIVYAIDNEKSFEKAKEILSDVKELNGKLPCAALVANKSDLWPHKSVERADGKDLADMYHCKYFEMSALSCKDGVLDMFSSVIHLAVERVKSRSVSLPANKVPINVYEDSRKRANSLQLTKKDIKQVGNNKSKSLPKTISRAGSVTFETKQNGNSKSKISHKTIGEMVGNLSLEGKQNGSNISKILQRTLGEMGNVTLETKQNGSKSKMLHKTLGDMGHLAFSAIAFPMTMNPRELKT